MIQTAHRCGEKRIVACRLRRWRRPRRMATAPPRSKWRFCSNSWTRDAPSWKSRLLRRLLLRRYAHKRPQKAARLATPHNAGLCVPLLALPSQGPFKSCPGRRAEGPAGCLREFRAEIDKKGNILPEWRLKGGRPPGAGAGEGGVDDGAGFADRSDGAGGGGEG